MRIIMLGTGPFAVPTLRALAAGTHEVPLVVSRPFKGRKNAPRPPMHAAAEELGIELWTPESVNLPASVERLKALEADLLVVCDYGEILKPAALEATRLGGVNLHGSLLPKYRGAAPVQWAVLKGDESTGATAIHMTPGLDAGPILSSVETAIDPDETAGELEDRLAILGARLMVGTLEDLESGMSDPEPQDSSAASKAPRLAKENGRIDWTLSAIEIKNQVRAMTPWPRAFSFWQIEGREPIRVVIDKVQTTAAFGEPEASAAGAAVEQEGKLLVQTGDGLLEIIELQPAGKRKMSAAEFLRGYAGGRFVLPQ